MRAMRSTVVVLALFSSSCVFGSAPVLAAGLRPFSDCDEFLTYVKANARERVGPYGLSGTGGYFGGPDFLAEGDAGTTAAAPQRAEASGASMPGVDYSGTNVQTAGVDEPDIVKTDGKRLLALARGKLFVVDLSGARPVLLGSLRLRDMYARDLLLLGNRALILGDSGGGAIPEPLARGSTPYGYGGSISAVVEVDLSDAAKPRVSRRLLVDGAYLSARMVGSVARVIVSSYPSLRFVSPDIDGLRGERLATRENRALIDRSKLEDWVPYFVTEDGDGRVQSEGSLLACTAAHHPPEFSGFGMLTVLTLDLAKGLGGRVAEGSVGVLAEGETVYASADSLYVASQRWVDWEAVDAGNRDAIEEGHFTRIHRFDISDPGRARYRSSGRVPGWLLNQFSMDEHDGHLRVASTESPEFFEGSSESTVTILAERGGRLVEVGSVSGLGKTERIFAVRFLGERGYVVTFREVDPLYVLDLSDPARPSVEGELKIPGYSAYLHPLPGDLLVGVGQDATNEGQLKGTHIQTFDVSDPASPRRIDSLRVSDGSSEAEWDHHAFLYWEPEGLVVVPLNVYGWDEMTGEPNGKAFFGALAARVTSGGELERAGRLSHDVDPNAESLGIRRSLVVGERLYTVSEAGVKSSELSSLQDVGWLPFA